MNRTALLTIILLSSLATPFVVQAMTPPHAATEAAVAAVAAGEPGKAAEPSCQRKVKVVYAGYGEGAGRACAAAK